MKWEPALNDLEHRRPFQYLEHGFLNSLITRLESKNWDFICQHFLEPLNDSQKSTESPQLVQLGKTQRTSTVR